MAKKGIGIGFLVLILIIVMIYFLIGKSPEDHAKAAIEVFYAFEQDGAYSDSWEMFHPLMQEKFEKGHYLQDRAHVFMNHFGVTTFEYTVEDATEVTEWQMDEEAEPIDTVYEATVSQVYKGKYGNFTLVQEVFAVELDGEWRILWDYNT